MQPPLHGSTAVFVAVGIAIMWVCIALPAAHAQTPSLLAPTTASPTHHHITPASSEHASSYLVSDRDGPVADISQVPVQGGWINSLPLNLNTLAQRNKVVLVEFWAYSCINCIRANAFTQQLWQRYKDHGLVVIGVHSLEFKFGGSPENILAAVKRQGLTYPILTDGHMRVWRAFNNRYWPAKYLFNAHGELVYHHFGEGNYAHEQQIIRQQLRQAGYELPDYGPLNPDVQLLPARRPQTPELYAGPTFMRRPYGNDKQPQTGVTTHFELPDDELEPDRIYLGGDWRGHDDYVQSTSPGTIALNYQAQAAYVVLASSGQPRTVTVTLDGAPVPPQFRGKDIHMRDGHTVMTVDAPRLYWPINNHAPYGRHTIRLHVPAGVRLYAFTFGTYQ